MAVATFVGLSIMITAAATLNAGGITEIRTSADAAEALRPAAGPLAMAVFSLGIIGTGLLAVPVLGVRGLSVSVRPPLAGRSQPRVPWKRKLSMALSPSRR